jgi:hypothetical protein
MLKKNPVRGIVVGVALVFCGSTAFADEGWKGDFDLGSQFNLQTTNQALFQQYLAKPDSMVLDGNVEYEGTDQLYNLQWLDLGGGNNNRADLSLEYQKNLTVDVNFLQYQHLYTNTAQSIFTETAPNLFRLPYNLQMADQGASTAAEYQNLVNQYMNAGAPITVGLQDSNLSGSAHYQFSPDLELVVGASQKWRSGDRPLGITLGGFSDVVQVAQQLDETTTQGNASLEYDSKNLAVRGIYDISVFNNDLPSLVVANPLVYSEAAGSPTFAQYSTAPSNMSNHFTLSAETDVIPKTRLAGDFSLGWWTQNQAFIPYTDNPFITVGTGGPAANQVSSLPAASLNGSEMTLAQNYVITSRPTDNLVVSARYKGYDLTNNDPVINLPGFVLYDTSWSAGALENSHFGYTDQRVEGKATWTLLKGVDVNGGYSSDWTDTTDSSVEEDVGDTCEQVWKGGLELKPVREVDLKCDVSSSDRVASQSDDLLYAALDGTLPGLRTFDVADRTSYDVATKATLTPFQSFWFAFAWTTGKENFQPGFQSLTTDSAYTASAAIQAGLIEDDHDYLTFSAHWQPLDGLELSGDVDKQVYNSTQNGFTSGAALAQAVTTLWTLNSQETCTYIAFDGDFDVSQKIQVHLGWSGNYSQGILGFVEGSADTVPGASSLPTVMTRMEDWKLGVTYRVNDTWSLRANYILEVYNESNFQTDDITTVENSSTGAFSALFLGGQNLPYRAQIMTVTATAKL